MQSAIVPLLIAVLTGASAASPATAQAPAGAPAQDSLDRMVREEDPVRLGVGQRVEDLTLVPIEGPIRTVSALLKDRKALVIVMTSAGCPISRKYAPRLATLERRYADKGIGFVYVNAVEAETPGEIRQQIREFALRGPYIVDRDLAVASRLGARTTSEVFVIDAEKTLAYRGALDDQYAIGAALNAPKRNFLSDALDAILAKRRPAVRATWAPGCLLDTPENLRATTIVPPAPKADQPAPATPTYYGRVADILAKNCMECHRNGGLAPFSLETFVALQGRASMIEAVVRDGLMPPTHGVAPQPPAGHPGFAQMRAMPEDERADLLAWIKGGRPLGEPRPLAALPPLSQTWTIGYPDILVFTPGLALPEDGPPLYARRVAALAIDSDRWGSAIELRPAERGTIQHAMAWLVEPGDAVPKAGAFPPTSAFLGAFSVSDNTIVLPPGRARAVRAGSLIVVDMYARPMGRPMAATMRLAMREFLPTPDAPLPLEQVGSFVIAADAVSLAPSQGPTVVTAERTLSAPLRVGAVTPYMRARGVSMRVSAAKPDGTSLVLLDAPRYDARWQIRYALAEDVVLPAGTVISVEGVLSNAPLNPANPDFSQAVAGGVGAGDEAVLVVLETVEPVPTK